MDEGEKMVFVVKIGRRTPKNFAKRLMGKIESVLSLQEQVWLLIVQAFRMAKKGADAKPDEQVIITIENKTESEGIYYQIEWKIITVSSIIHSKELEEYNEVMNMYEKFSILRKQEKKLEGNEELSNVFKSNVVTKEQFAEAKEKGFGAVGDVKITDKLLELGIMTYVEKSW